MFCLGWQIDVGCFVRGGKKWHGMFCPGMFCPTFFLDIYKYQALRIYILMLSYWHTVQRIIQVCPPSVCPVIRLNLDPEIKQTIIQETWYAIRWQCADYARHFWLPSHENCGRYGNRKLKCCKNTLNPI